MNDRAVRAARQSPHRWLLRVVPGRKPERKGRQQFGKHGAAREFFHGWKNFPRGALGKDGCGPTRRLGRVVSLDGELVVDTRRVSNTL